MVELRLEVLRVLAQLRRATRIELTEKVSPDGDMADARVYIAIQSNINDRLMEVAEVSPRKGLRGQKTLYQLTDKGGRAVTRGTLKESATHGAGVIVPA